MRLNIRPKADRIKKEFISEDIRYMENGSSSATVKQAELLPFV